MKNYSFLIFLTITLSAFSQNELDALRYSNDGLQGTARALGMGGAMSAVGADLTAAALNPAGLGLYQFTDVSVTMNGQSVADNSTYFSNKSSYKVSPFFFNSAGIAINGKLFDDMGQQKKHGLKSYNVAFGYQRLDNYKGGFDASGYNAYNSVTDHFVQLANGTPTTLFATNTLAGAAYDSYAINPIVGQNNQYFGAFPNGGVQQTISLRQAGKKGETYLAMAANINDKLYIGGRVGFQSIKYEESLSVTEEDTKNLHQTYQDDPAQGNLDFPAKKYIYNTSFSDAGSGINFQFGLIYRPINNLRVGVSILSPTRVSLTDAYQFSMHNTFSLHGQDTTATSTSESLTSNYTVKTPYQLNMGAAYIVGKRGFLTADVNIKDYTTALLRSDLDRNDPNYYSYDTENQHIANYLKMTVNYRLGGEFRLQSWRFRLGTGAILSPLKADVATYQDSQDPTKIVAYKPTKQYFTGGIGYRAKEYYIDLAYIYQTQPTAYAPYLLTGDNMFTPAVVSNKITQSFVGTVGLCF